jgi:hypothetical protein
MFEIDIFSFWLGVNIAFALVVIKRGWKWQ